MTARQFLWIATGGGTWSLDTNWDDQTDGQDPSLLVPGAQDDVTIAGPGGTGTETITGPGLAAIAVMTGNTTLSGSFGFGALTAGADGAGGLLGVSAGGVVQAGTAALDSGSLVVNGAASQLIVSGGLTLGTGQSGNGAASATLDATSGGFVQAQALTLDGSAAHIYVDPASAVEVGQAGDGQAGQFTVDAGATVSGFGDADGYGSVTNDGTIAAEGGSLLVGRVAGTGTLEIDAGAILDVNGACGPGEAVVFAGANATLALSAEYDTPQGTLTGFSAGDGIDMLGSPISSALYAQTGQDSGLLTLTYGGQIAATFILAGNYSSDVFLTSGDGDGGTLVTLSSGGGNGGGLSGGTSTPDVYTWVAPGSGRWNVAANWQDVTAGKNPAKVAPGVNNLVTIAAPTDGFDVIAGPGDAATLSLTGEVALSGAFAFGTLTVGSAVGYGTPGTLDLLPGTAVTASTAAIADGAISVSGASTSLSVSGTLSLGGGILGVGLPTATLSAVAGGKIQVGSLVLGGGSGDWITTDPTGSIEIGTAGGAVQGAFTVDAGASVTGNGSIDPFGEIVDRGTITASGGLLVLGQVTGSGVLAVAAGAALEIETTTSLGIVLTGPGATLALSSELAAPIGVLSGFVPGDTIDVLGDEIDQVRFTADQSGNSGTLYFYYGTTQVAAMDLAGSFSGERFLVAPDGNGGTDVLLDTSGGGGGGGGGQGTTDVLAWTSPVSGAWSNAHNWTDLTTGSPANAPPGLLDPVQVAGPTDGSFQTLGGPGGSASLTFTGDTLLTGAFTTGALAIGAVVSGTLEAGFAELNSTASLVAQSGTIESGNLLVTGNGAAVTMSGTLTLGGQGAPVADLDVVARGIVQLGGLSLLGGSLETDPTGSIEIGTAGGAAAGAVTLDAGVSVSGYGSVAAAGQLVDLGTLEAAGGTLVVGNVSGSGLLSIGTEATLSLAGTDSCAVSFAGGGSTLVLAGTAEAPAAVIAGFGAGDGILIASSQVSSVSYQPGSGDIGTLTLSYGGQVAATLLLAGDYTGDTFSVQPTDAGALITVQPYDGQGPSPGTPTPDVYVWTGAADTSWNTAGNWIDVTAGQNPAHIAPGQNNLVTIQGPAQGYQAVTGPADAAALSILGDVSLSGTYAIGTLAIGGGTTAGLLALGSGTDLAASGAAVNGGIVAGGGTLAVGGALALGTVSGEGALYASLGSTVTMRAATLNTAASAIATDDYSSVEIGGNADGTYTNGTAGTVTVDASGLLSGQGSVNLTGATADFGTITASGGLLSLGAVSGTGTLLIGPDAGLALDASVAGGLVIDFSAAGTLTLADGMLAAGIAGFASGDEILLPGTGATSADYAQTGAGTGLLSVYAGGELLDQLTLLGVDAGAVFSVAAGPQGGTILTTAPAGGGGDGGGTMGINPQSGPEDPGTFIDDLPYYAQYWIGQALGFGTNDLLTPYVWVSPDGTGLGDAVPIYANFGVVTDPVAGSVLTLPEGYKGLIAEGSDNIVIGDFNVGGTGGAVLVGNLGDDTIVGADGDTLVGGLGANTVFVTDTQVTIQGGGNDLYYTGIGDVTIITSDARSLIGLGSAHNLVTCFGQDTVACLGGGITSDTVDASQSDKTVVVFGPSSGLLDFTGGAAPETIVGSSGEVDAVGGSGGDSFDPTVFWCGSGFSAYTAGSGASAVVGGSGELQVGAPSDDTGGPVTVYGGSGDTQIWGTAGNSVFLVGFGADTVHAASGNDVYVTASANVYVTGAGSGIFVYAAGSTGNDTLQSGAGYESMVGGQGNDQFIVGNGQGLFEGLGGANVYDFSYGFSGGSATIYDFDTTQDKIGLHGYAGGAQAALNSETVAGGNTSLTLGDGTRVVLLGVTNLTVNSFSLF